VSRGVQLGGSDFIVSLGSFHKQIGTYSEQAGTFMHELGHNLGLHHGGQDDIQYKPNYLSVMNYLFQTSGLTINNASVFDYSKFLLSDIPDLDENNLNEGVGLNSPAAARYGTQYWGFGVGCPFSMRSPPQTTPVINVNAPIDWNCDVSIQGVPIKAEINGDSSYDVLTSFDDWSSLIFSGGSIGALGLGISQAASTPSQELTTQQDAQITKPFWVAVSGPNLMLNAPGDVVPLTYSIMNAGENADTYALTATSSMPWTDFSQLPSTVTLAPGATAQVKATVTVPSSANAGTLAELVIQATSKANPGVVDRALTDISISPGATPTFVLSAAPPSSTVTAGKSATYILSVAPVGVFTQPISLSCSGAPTSANCNLSQSSLTLNGITTVNISVTLNTTARQAAGVLRQDYRFHFLASSLAIGLIVFPLMAVGGSRGQFPRVVRIGVCAVGLAVSISCGGGGTSGSGTNSGPPPTPKGTYTITLTGTSGTITQNVTVSLAVQ